jgi:hypothetical protein
MSYPARFAGARGLVTFDRLVLTWQPLPTTTGAAQRAVEAVNLPFAAVSKLFSSPKAPKLKLVAAPGGPAAGTKSFEFEFEDTASRDAVKEGATVHLRAALREKSDALRKAVLLKSPALLAAYNDTVLSGAVTPDEFWASRQSLLADEELTSQETGRSSVMPDLGRLLATSSSDDPITTGKDLKEIQLTKDVFEFIMNKVWMVWRKDCYPRYCTVPCRSSQSSVKSTVSSY